MALGTIIKTTRDSLGISSDGDDFKEEINTHIRAALAILNQNGIGVENLDLQESTTWEEFKDLDQRYGNLYFHLVPMFVFTKTKILFDPPPPSNVEFYANYIDELLWRLRIEYERDQVEEE